MKISIEELVELITRKVISELIKRGIDVDFNTDKKVENSASLKTSFEIDMSIYKTPVLTENNLSELDPNIVEIIIPVGTIITPSAKDLIRKKKLIITYKNKLN